MKPAPFHWHGPESVAEAVAVLAEHGDAAKVLAGGQSLIPVLAMRLASPAHIVDINRIAGLDAVRADAAGVTVGIRYDTNGGRRVGQRRARGLRRYFHNTIVSEFGNPV